MKESDFPSESEHASKICRQLEERKEKHLLRTLQTVEAGRSRRNIDIGGKTFLNFCSNDYLGLSGHPELISRSVSFTEQYGTGSSASRLVSGSLTIHHELEEKIAFLYGAEACLLFGSGFQANSTILPAMAGRGDLILADKRIHNSLIHGGTTSRATFRRFRHNDCDHLERLLQEYRQKSGRGTCWVVTESLFSMDGDLAPLEKIGRLCRRFGASLMVDDAHAFGLYGKKGLGLGEGRHDIDLLVGTFGKSAGGYGAFAVCSKVIKEYLINYCSGIIYSTSPPPALVGAADAAMDLIPGMTKERDRLRGEADRLIKRLNREGFDTGGSRSHIIPVIVGDEQASVDLSSALCKHRIFAQAIRPPAVQQSRIRLTITAWHTRQDLDRLIEAVHRG